MSRHFQNSVGVDASDGHFFQKEDFVKVRPFGGSGIPCDFSRVGACPHKYETSTAKPFTHTGIEPDCTQQISAHSRTCGLSPAGTDVTRPFQAGGCVSLGLKRPAPVIWPAKSEFSLACQRSIRFQQRAFPADYFANNGDLIKPAAGILGRMYGGDQTAHCSFSPVAQLGNNEWVEAVNEVLNQYAMPALL